MGPTDRLREEISMLKAENTRLMQEREKLMIDLEECRSDLFKRIPPDQISDESIRKALERIRTSIDSFVVDTMEDVAEDLLYSFCQRKQQKRKQEPRNPQNSLDDWIMMQDIRVWGPYECSNFYILSVIIQWVLEEYVFKYKYPLGITEEQGEILEDVERGMWNANRMQKPERLDVWRSDTLTALTTLPQNELCIERTAGQICIKLTDILSPWLFAAGPFSKVEARFRDEILDPAIKLHQHLKSASHQYETRYVKVLDRHSPKQMLDEWDLIDADFWQPVRAERPIGRALYCLHPSIIRFRAGSKTPIVVAKPVIVVQGPDWKTVSDSRGRKDSSLDNMTVLPAATNPSPATHHVASSSKQGSSAQERVAEKTSTFIDSISNADSSRSRQPHHHRKPHVAKGGKGQPVSGRPPRADPQDVPLPSTRGHNVEGSSHSRPSSQAAAAVRPQPSSKSSRHASSGTVGEKPRSVKTSSVPGQSSSAGNNSRSLKSFFGQQ